MEKDFCKNLFIIGNGFDIAHGIKSRYSDFHEFIRSLYVDDQINNYAKSPAVPWIILVPENNRLFGGFDLTDAYVRRNVLAFLDYFITKSQNHGYGFYNCEWHDLEHTLGDLNLKLVLEYEEELLSKIDVEQKIYDITNCVKVINTLISMWADSIELKDIKPIHDFENIINTNRLLPENNDAFISFNYTKTLEEVYDIKNVFHIHGISGGKVILGHSDSVNVQNFIVKNSVPYEGERAAEVLLKETEKNVSKCSKRLINYIEKYGLGLSDIYSYGFSFSDVDIPYIRTICETIDTSNLIWHISDYSMETNGCSHKDIILKSGFKGIIDTFHINNKTLKRHFNPFHLFN